MLHAIQSRIPFGHVNPAQPAQPQSVVSDPGAPPFAHALAADTVQFGACKSKPTAAEKRLMARAVEVSQASKDPSRKIGAVIANAKGEELVSGYNHFPTGVSEEPEERWERPIKYDYIGHAETNAIGEAARTGVATDGTKMVVNLFPCLNCTKTVLASGVKELVTVTPDFDDPKWGPEFVFAKKILEEAGVKLRLFSAEEFGI